MIYGITSKQSELVSFVFPILLEADISILVADEYVTSILKPNRLGYQRIIKAFGNHVCLPNGELNKEALRHLLTHSTHRQTFYYLLYGSVREEMLVETERMAEQNPHQRFAWIFPFAAHRYFQQNVKRMLVLAENIEPPYIEESENVFVLHPSYGNFYIHDEVNRFLAHEKNA